MRMTTTHMAEPCMASRDCPSCSPPRLLKPMADEPYSLLSIHLETRASVMAGHDVGDQQKASERSAPFNGRAISSAIPSPRASCPSTDQKVHLQVFQKYFQNN